MSMRTVVCEIASEHPIVPYLWKNTSGSRAVRNRANFLISNTMTGIRKSPEERTHNETEALHTVFTGIQKANIAKRSRVTGSARRGVLKAKRLKKTGMQAHACIGRTIRAAETPIPCPDLHHWFLGYDTLDAILKYTNDPAYYSCTSQVNQQALRKTVESWTSYFRSLKEWKKCRDRFKAVPRIPGYLRGMETTAHFTSQVCGLQAESGKLYLVFTGFPDRLCIGKDSLFRGKYVCTEVKPFYGRYRLYLTYDDGMKMPEVPENPSRGLGLDPGVGNFLAGLSNSGAAPFLIRGGFLKSVNQWYNKRKAELKSRLEKSGQGKDSHALQALSIRRERMIREFFCKTAHWIMRWCKANRIEVVVIGHNEGQKQRMDNGDQNNQNFVGIPYSRFFLILKTVGIRYGIPVVEREESYTSQASLLDLDSIPTYGEKDADKASFSGKRIKRGLYRSSDGSTLNADVNGAGNILRREYPHIFDGMNLSTACGKAAVVTGEELLGIRSRMAPVHYRKKPGTGAMKRHQCRKERRQDLQMLWGKWKSPRKKPADKAA